MFNKLVIENTSVKKIRSFFVFVEEFHLPHSQVSLRGDRIFHHIVPSRLYRNSKLNFLVNFEWILLTSKRSLIDQRLVKDV